MTQAAPHISLEHEARRVLPALRAAIALLLEALPGAPTRPRDLVVQLGIHHTLAWKLIHVARTGDPFASARHIPGRPGIDAFLATAAEHGAPQQRITAVQEAYAAYRAMVKRHAGDRPSLDLMLAGLANGRDAGIDHSPLRRAAFLCNSSTWGVQVRTRVLCKVLHPSETPSGAPLMDIALVRLFAGMRRVRPEAPLVLSRAVIRDNDAVARRVSPIEPIDPEGASAALPLIPAFCTQPLPEIEAAPGPEGVTEHRVVGGPVGEAAAVTVCSGQLHRAAASSVRDAHNTASRTAVEVRLPIETLVIDVWAHRDICPDAAPRARTYSELSGVPWYRQTPDHLHPLPTPEHAERRGWGLSAAHLPAAPEYTDLMRHCFDHLRWNPDHHVLHRLTVEFPVLATAVVLELDLPDAP